MSRSSARHVAGSPSQRWSSTWRRSPWTRLPSSASSALAWSATTATRCTSRRRLEPRCWPWFAGRTSRRVATGSSPCGRRISNDSPPGKSSRRSRSKPGSTATPEPETPARPPLRVALDAHAFAEDATGVGRYIGALIEAFRVSQSVDLMPYRDSGPRLVGPHLALPLRMRRDGARLVHGPANALPLLNTGLPGAVTIHDLAIYDHPEWFPAGQWFATRVVVPQSVRRARAIICPSIATSKALVRHFQVDPQRCRVIPHGVEAEFSLPASPAIRADLR